MIVVHKIENTPIPSNCFVVFDKEIGNSCIIVDPGSNDGSALFDFLSLKFLNPQFIILTHEHFDHCWGVNSLRERYNDIKLICSSECSKNIQNKKKNYSVFYEQPGFELDSADIEIEENKCLDILNKKVFFTLAKGHSASGIIFTIDNYLFTGDELIKDVKTVTKLKTGSKEQLKESLIFIHTLQGKNLKVCPGHGETFELDSYIL